MADTTGERLAALEAAFKEFKDAITKLVSQQSENLKDAITEQSKNLGTIIASLDKLLWRAIIGGIAATASLWAGFAVLYKEIDGLDRRVGAFESQFHSTSEAVKDQVAQLKGVTSSMGGNVEALQAAAGNIRDAAGLLAAQIKNIPKTPPGPSPNPGEAPGTLNILVFGEFQEALIRKIPIDVGAVSVSLADKLRLGDFIKDPDLVKLLHPWPDYAFKQVPQLEMTNFVAGEVRIAIARAADNRVVAVVAR